MQAVSRSYLNDEWITDAEIPDPDVLPKLPGYHILVRPVSIKGQTKGGILLPDSTKSDMAYLTTVGRVLVIGNLAYQDKKFNDMPWCKEGDYVMFRANSGTRFKIGGAEFRLMNDDSIEAVVPDPRGVTRA